MMSARMYSSVLLLCVMNVVVLAAPNYKTPPKAWSKLNDTVKFSFASYFSDGMVLQMGPQKAQIWGYAPPDYIGDLVVVSIDGLDHFGPNLGVVQQGPDPMRAVWNVTFREPVNQGGPYVIRADTLYFANSPQRLPITLKDVMFGDVWLCSGQSNMQFTITQMFGSWREIREADDYKDVRLLNVDRVSSPVPLYDLKKILMPWSKPGANRLWTGFSAVCYLYGKYLNKYLGRPIGLIDSTWGGTPVEAWSSTEALKQCGLADVSPTSEKVARLRNDTHTQQNVTEGVPNENSVLWNAMIHPLLNMTIKGAIWYQGEANADYHADKYNCTFSRMILDWRKNFNLATRGQVPLNMPFGFVQIGPRRTSFDYAIIRWEQLNVRKYLDNVFMAVAMDLTDDKSPYGDVHIRDKTTVARRLFKAGLATAYFIGSKDIITPLPDCIVGNFSGDHVTISLNFSTQITVHTLDGFEVCDSDCLMNSTKNFTPIPIVSYTENSISLIARVNSTSWNKIIRYAWSDVPCDYKQCALYNAYSGFPVPPLWIDLLNIQQCKWTQENRKN